MTVASGTASYGPATAHVRLMRCCSVLDYKKPQLDLADLDLLVLAHGSHSSRAQGVCLQEAVAWFAGEKHSDHPACTDSVVAAYARRLNDVMPDEQRQRLRPFIPLLAGTSNGCPPATRAILCADKAVRVFAVSALNAAGFDHWADQLAALDPITDGRAADAATRAAAYAADAAAADAAAIWDGAIDLLRELIEAHA